MSGLADWLCECQKHAMLIYKIFRPGEWDQLQNQGQSLGAPIDLADGYIHFSTADQVAETLAKHFAGVDGLYLCAVEADDLADALKWEPSRGGALFPHLFRALRLDEVRWSTTLPVLDGRHLLPDTLA